MAIQVISGTRDTLNITQARRKIDMSDTIALLQPSATPLISLLKQIESKVKPAISPKFSWLEDDLGPRWDAINNGAGYSNSDTNLVVDNGVYFTPGDIVKVPRTEEVMLVTQVNNATNTITVVRGYGTTTAASLNDDDALVIIGNANMEGSGTREIKTTKEVEVYNYTQIFKTPFGVTNTENASALYGGKDMNYQAKKKGIEHLVDMTRAFYFGERKEDNTGSKPRRTTGGILSFLTENNYDAQGDLTEDEFDTNVAEHCFRYGSHEKLALCSARALTVINSWAKNKLQVNLGAKKYGLDVVDYITPFGILHLVYDPILEGPVYGGYMVILDTENIKYRPLQGRDTKLETNIQDNDADQRIDQYITEAGIEVRLPKTHALVTGITGAGGNGA